MRIRNNNPLDLEGNDGEQIVVDVQSSDTKRSLAGEQIYPLRSDS